LFYFLLCEGFPPLRDVIKKPHMSRRFQITEVKD
jgi:hypothetical protein